MTTERPHREARAAERIKLSVPARLMIEGEELSASVRDVSVTGLALDCPARPRMGATAIIYVDGLSRFEGRVARYFKGGFAVTYALTGAKRDRIAAKLMAIASEAPAGGAHETDDKDAVPAAAAEGYVLRQKGSQAPIIAFADGSPFEAEILDVSVVGVTLRTDVRPKIGTRLLVRGMQASITRHTAEGVMAEFEDYWEGVASRGSWTAGEVRRP